MKYETKYLIRWGIPGWVFLLSILILYGTYNNKFFSAFTTDPVKLISFVVAVASIGVPVGYIFHQIYFGRFWVMSKKKGIEMIIQHIDGYKRKYREKDVDEEYFYLEYLWQSELSLLGKDHRDYIAERYRHLLSTTHSLGVLTVSLSCSFLVNLFALKEMNIFWGDKIFFGAIIFLLIIINLLNYWYYSSKTHAFMGMFLNEFINNKERNKERKQKQGE
ncbi:hypothetical protein [Neobacillus sp. YIM B06451]|uniref:hypothetical protein n=1 Tax=Neobacillus sp. YIM B06451 TaxID=3070994 RepID=UPI00292FA57C|nr:hypothetical protein [Neobacillus sp. YIM B06451]